VEYGHDPGTIVYNWPAKDGFYGTSRLKTKVRCKSNEHGLANILPKCVVYTTSAVEVEFLGFDKFKSAPPPSPDNPPAGPDEEAHCSKSMAQFMLFFSSLLTKTRCSP
jgi:hypothetical protein